MESLLDEVLGLDELELRLSEELESLLDDSELLEERLELDGDVLLDERLELELTLGLLEESEL